MTKINYAGPDISTDDADFVRDAVLNGFYENYRKHAQLLENRLCEYLNVKHAYVTNSCTAAIHLALASIDLDKDDEVIKQTVVVWLQPCLFCILNQKLFLLM